LKPQASEELTEHCPMICDVCGHKTILPSPEADSPAHGAAKLT
jgi:hypothetical protein